MKTLKTPETTLRLACYLLTLPDGSWAETQEAEAQLEDMLPRGISLPAMMERH